MGYEFERLARSVARDGHVSNEEILDLRRQGWSDGKTCRQEAEALFAINNNVSDHSEEWIAYFVDAITSFVLTSTEPYGMCTSREADWLIGQIEHDGRVDSLAELSLLIHLIERSKNLPTSLKTFILNEIEQAVLTGTGPTRCGGVLSDTHITSTECQYLRRVVFAVAGSGTARASREDADMLFRIKDATLGHDNAPEWPQLFVDGVASYVQGFCLPHAHISAERLTELEDFMKVKGWGRGGFAWQVIKRTFKVRQNTEAFRSFVKTGSVLGKYDVGYAALEAEGAETTDSEQKWLSAQTDADGKFDELERALLERLRADADTFGRALGAEE